MSTSPVWWFFRIFTEDAPSVSARFEAASRVESAALVKVGFEANDWAARCEAPRRDDLPRLAAPFIRRSFVRILSEIFYGSAPIPVDKHFIATPYVRLDRVPPPMVLWIGLRPRRAAALPGFFGNFALSPSELPEAAADVGRMLAEASDDFFTRASIALSWGANDVERDARLIFEALPIIMADAQRSGCGLLGICAEEVPLPHEFEGLDGG